MSNENQLEQVAIRMVRMPPLLSKEPMNNPEAVIRIMNETLKEFDREAVAVVNLQSDLKPINMNFVSIGTLNASIAHPREILKTSILSNASSIILFHNHPSGSLRPSKEDVELTDRLQKICNLIQIPIMDHIIIGTDDRYYSFREKGILKIPDMHITNDIDSFRWEGSKVAEHKEYFDPKKAAEERKQEMKDITDRLEKGVADIFQSDNYQRFLNTMAKFPQYSFNNNLLIMMQKPDATLCQSYSGWKKMGRFVKKGEKGIRILAPTPYMMEREQNKLDDKGKAVLDKDGEPVKEKVQINITAFKPVSTFDLSQTDGEPLPTIGISELTGSVEGYETLFEAIKNISPVPIGLENIKGSAKGYFNVTDNRIAIQEGMDEIQNVKTAIHEIAHAKLHNMEVQKSRGDGGQSRSSKEVEAESVAYTVCQHFGIDTSDYSFAYVAGWSHGKEMPELKESLNTIRTAASELITSIEENAQALIKEREQRMPEKSEISFYVAECGEFHSMGEFQENLTLEEAIKLYRQIPSERLNGIKTIGFHLKDENVLADEFDLVAGDRLNIQTMKEIVPELAEHPLVQKACEDIQILMPEIIGEKEQKGAAEENKDDLINEMIQMHGVKPVTFDEVMNCHEKAGLNAWYGKNPRDFHFISPRGKLEFEGHVYEISYENYSAVTQITENGELLFDKEDNHAKVPCKYGEEKDCLSYLQEKYADEKFVAVDRDGKPVIEENEEKSSVVGKIKEEKEKTRLQPKRESAAKNHER